MSGHSRFLALSSRQKYLHPPYCIPRYHEFYSCHTESTVMQRTAMTCYIPPPLRPSRLRSLARYAGGVLALSTLFGAVTLLMFLISAFVEN
jgi:hypothetical protein